MRFHLTPVICAVALCGCQSKKSSKTDPPAATQTRASAQSAAPGQADEPPYFKKAKKTPSHTKEPKRVPASDDRISSLRLPAGFSISVFARDLDNPRMMHVLDDGTVLVTLVTQMKPGSVVALIDRDGDGKADARETLARGLDKVHGITVHNGKLYLAQPTRVVVAPLQGRKLGKLTPFMTNLPKGERHANRTIAFGPDGYFYISVGSSCDACVEENPEHATILRSSPDGKSRSVFARGLRNTIGFDWHPKTKVMWGMDHGSDHRGDNIPPEELNRLEQGKDYGWPYVFGERVLDPLMDDPPGMTHREYAAKTVPAVLTYRAHSAPIGMLFYTGKQFPARYQNDAFVAMRGSWNRIPPSGYKLVRIVFDEKGEPERFEDFVTRFLVDNGDAHFGRIAGLAIAKDGALLLSDDSNGVIYRITYRK